MKGLDLGDENSSRESPFWSTPWRYYMARSHTHKLIWTETRQKPVL